MALKNQLNFASGEIDPVLHDRVTLQRFQNGLATARNVMIGKTGSVISRFSRKQFKEISHSGPVKLFCPPSKDLVIEAGVRSTDDKFYVRIYDLEGNVTGTGEEPVAGDTGITVDTFSSLQFLVSENLVYFFLGSNNSSDKLYRTSLPNGGITQELFDIPDAPVYNSFASSGTGYDTDYAVTTVVNGEESEPVFISQATKLPINNGEEVSLTVEVVLTAAELQNVNNIRIYRRPKAGSAYGFVGSSSEITGTSGGGFPLYTFVDIGAAADFTNGLPTLVSREGISNAKPLYQFSFGTGVIHQGRMILGNVVGVNGEAILASRPIHRDNFYRDFPYDSDSALLMNTGTEGEGVVTRMITSNGLVVFTTKGVFTHTGLLSPTNTYFEKRGSWVIDESIEPLTIPGALLFVDKSTGSVRQLVYSQELGGYDSINQSVFSDHLFRERTITSWSFQEGNNPLLLVTFDDGTFASFTYSFEHQMRAWTRHDSKLFNEQVVSSAQPDISFFLVRKEDGTRYIEKTVPRRITPSILNSNPEADKYEYGALMDSIVTFTDRLNDYLFDPNLETLVVAPVIPGDWSGQLTITSGVPIFTVGNNLGVSGDVYRVFDSTNKVFIDLEFVSKTDDLNVVVQPSEEFPSNQANTPNIYVIRNTITGLSHLEGEEVSVMVDGNVISSPNNDNDMTSSLSLVVTGGEITIPSEFAGGITVVGRPVTADIQTLNVSTVEQSPTTIESLTANKLYIRTYKSRGLYVDNLFPEEKIGEKDGATVEGMQELDRYYEQSGVHIVGNRNKQPDSRRAEVTVSGSWDSQGKISIRQVDPLHFEIMSIIVDLEVERRR